MRRKTTWLAALVALVFMLSCSDESPVKPSRSPRVMTVDPYGTTGYLTTRDALNVAIDGDTIELVNGRHSGPGNRDLDFGGRSIVLRSQRGNALNCIIDADGYYLQAPEPHFNFRFGLRQSLLGRRKLVPKVIVENLRIEDGFESVLCDSGSAPVFKNCTFEYSYRAVVSNAASPVFVNCSFDNNAGGALVCEQGSTALVAGGRVWQNYSFDDGAGIFVRGSSLQISDCQFIRNSTTGRGAAIYSAADEKGNRSSVVAMRSRFLYQGSNEAVWLEQTDFAFDECVFSDNGGPMFVYEFSEGRFVGSIFYGEGIYLDSGSSATIESCIIVFNGGGPGVDCGFDGTATVQMSCSDLYGNTDECILDQIGSNGNLSADPLFCYFEEGDFSLDPNSPVVTNANCALPGGWLVGCGPAFPRER